MSDQNMNRWLHTRCTDREHSIVKTLSIYRGESMSAVVRQAVRAEAKRAGVLTTTRGGRHEQD